MSRTNRQFPTTYFIWRGQKIETSDVDWKTRTVKGSNSLFEEIYSGWSCHQKFIEDYNAKSPDSKPYYKPNKKFKKPRRQQERSRAKQAIREDKEPERVRRSDIWDWN